jgi:hypothetical protein
MNKNIYDYLNKRLKVVFVSKRNSIIKKITKSDVFISVAQPNYGIPISKLIKGEMGRFYDLRIVLI